MPTTNGSPTCRIIRSQASEFRAFVVMNSFHPMVFRLLKSMEGNGTNGAFACRCWIFLKNVVL